MNGVSQTPETIFGEAIEISSRQARSLFLDQACQGNPELRGEVERLVEDHFRAGSFLESPAADLAVTTDHRPIAERPGTVIGFYKLLQQIGEGGMGVVFMAEQTEPLQRTVALKIIKPGMDTRQVIARFEAERQAVAMMDHPNIAKVLDAGTTESRLPYFVMELVKGVPITKYCDDKHLPLRTRLELFVQVCQAVQHAHQKGIIHRDIKPNNVLVAEYDNHAVPKVIDFGVAKATAQKLTERTMFTEFGQVLGTMEYMSPEQSKFNQLDIDTRSDIYSLGVLLYELLAGSTPFEGKRLHDAAFDEMLRIIREEEPPKPSTRLSSLSSRERAIDSLPLAGRVGEGVPSSLASIAANRHTEPARLSKDVRGELDWIVMKALEKDRNRRYETASGFAADIERHLHDEPVEAGPPSATYRFRKFARRNKRPLAAAAAVLAALVIGLGLSTWLYLQERAAWQRAVAAEQEQQRLREEAEIARAIETDLRREAEVRATVARAQLLFDQGNLEEAEKLMAAELATSTSAELKYSLAEECSHLGRLLRDKQLLQEAERMHRQAISFREPLGAEAPPNVRLAQANDYNDLGFVLVGARRLPEAERAVRTALEMKQSLVKAFPDNRDYPMHLAHSYLGLGHIISESGRTSDAIRAYGEAESLLDVLASKPRGSESYRIFLGKTLRQLGDGWLRLERLDDAEKVHQKALKSFQELAVADPANRYYRQEQGFTHRTLADVAEKAGRTDDAEGHLVDSLSFYRNLVAEVPDSPFYRQETAFTARSLADMLLRSGKHREALEEFSQAIKFQPERWETWSGRAAAHFHLQQWDKAVADYSEAIELAPEVHTHWLHRGHSYLQLAKWDEAAADFTKVIERWPHDTGGWFFRGCAYAQLNQPEKAIADLRQSIAKDLKHVAEHLKNQSLLDPLRSNEEFKKLLAAMEAEQK